MMTSKSSQNVLYIIGLFTTIAIWPNFMEPFNFPKFVILMFLTAIVLGRNLAVTKLVSVAKNFNLINGLILIFLVYFWIRTLLNQDIYTGIFGSYGRYTGALTYTCWMLILLQGSLLKNHFDPYVFIKYFYWTTLVVYSYAIMQVINFDILGWEALYDGVFSTLGNPNFLSAYTAVVTGTSVWLLLYPNESFKRFIPVIFLIASLYVQTNTSSLQGYVLSIYTITLLLILKFYETRNQLWMVVTGVSFFGAILGLMGIMNMGPLRSWLFQSSNIYRLDFWKTGINMIEGNPLFGVGIERYGAYFRRYREIEQIFRTDPNQTSDSAHNIVIHLGATGGMPLALLFTLIVLILIFKALYFFKSRHDLKSGILFFVLSTTILLQNLLSVDNLSLSTWQWIFFAALASEVSKDKEVSVQRKIGEKFKSLERSKQDSREVLLRFALVLLVFFSLLRPISSQILMKDNFYLQVNLSDSRAVAEKLARLKNTLDTDSRNIFLARLGANSLFIDQAWEAAAEIASRGSKIDSDDYVVWWFLASALEEKGNIEESIAPRLKTIKLDPYNYFNYYLLCNSYSKLGDRGKLEKCAEKLYEIAPGSQEAQVVLKLLVP